MNEKTVKNLAYLTTPFLTIAVVAGVAAAAPPSSGASDSGRQRPVFSQEQREGRRLHGGQMNNKKHGAMQVEHQAVQAALDAGDYQAFVTATANAPFADKVNEDFFAKFQEAHAHFEAGQAIMESLGVKGPKRFH